MKEKTQGGREGKTEECVNGRGAVSSTTLINFT